jgi:glucan biosynthesis protein C
MQKSIVSQQTGSATLKAVRLHYLDSLRVLAIMLVFLYHTGRAFNLDDWHVKNVDQSMAISVILAFFEPWGMPFFFLLSGAGAMFALRRRNARQYLSERVLRLLIPFFAGSLLFTPLQLYLEWADKTRRGIQLGSFREFITGSYLPHIPLTNPAFFGAVGVHLWFLGFLFLAALITLPLLLWLKRTPTVVGWLAGVCERRGGILVFILPLVLVLGALLPLFPGDRGWAMFTFMAAYVVAGYVLLADPRFIPALRRDWWIVLTGGVAGFLALGGNYAAGLLDAWQANPGVPQYYLFWAIFCLDSWCWTMVALLLGVRFMDVHNRWVDYGQEAVLPFYILHQPVILVVAFQVVQWQVGIPLKWLTILVTSFVVAIALYELLIRRVNLLRMAFGLLPRPAPMELGERRTAA